MIPTGEYISSSPQVLLYPTNGAEEHTFSKVKLDVNVGSSYIIINVPCEELLIGALCGCRKKSIYSFLPLQPSRTCTAYQPIQGLLFLLSPFHLRL